MGMRDAPQNATERHTDVKWNFTSEINIYQNKTVGENHYLTLGEE